MVFVSDGCRYSTLTDRQAALLRVRPELFWFADKYEWPAATPSEVARERRQCAPQQGCDLRPPSISNYQTREYRVADRLE
jgi:hypothetical protein